MLVADDRIDRRVLLEADSLVRAGATVRIVALPYPAGLDDDARMFPDVEILRVDLSNKQVRQTRTSRVGPLAAFGPLLFLHHDRFLASAVAEVADVVVAHDLPTLLTAALAADELGARLFFDAHELYPEQQQLPTWRRLVYRWLESQLLPHVDSMITVNASIAAELRRRGSPSFPSVILNLPAANRSVQSNQTAVSSLRDTFSVPFSKRLVLMHGSLSPSRNLETLVDSMGLLQGGEVALVLMGPDGGVKAALEARARELGLLGESVFFHEPVAQDELLATVATADIGIVPYEAIDLNTRFCTPNKLFDFIAAGLPVLANDLPELRRFVTDRGLGLNLPMQDARAMASAINAMLLTDLTSMSARARAAAPNFLWEAQEASFLKVFGLTKPIVQLGASHVRH